MAGTSKEEQLQEALIGWILAGGNCEGLIAQIDAFFDGLEEFETCAERAVEFGRLRWAIKTVQEHAARVDRAGGFPELWPAAKQKAADRSAPAQVLVEVMDGRVAGVRSSRPLIVAVWPRDEVREGLVPTTLLELPRQPLRVLSG